MLFSKTTCNNFPSLTRWLISGYVTITSYLNNWARNSAVAKSKSCVEIIHADYAHVQRCTEDDTAKGSRHLWTSCMYLNFFNDVACLHVSTCLTSHPQILKWSCIEKMMYHLRLWHFLIRNALFWQQEVLSPEYTVYLFKLLSFPKNQYRFQYSWLQGISGWYVGVFACPLSDLRANPLPSEYGEIWEIKTIKYTIFSPIGKGWSALFGLKMRSCPKWSLGILGWGKNETGDRQVDPCLQWCGLCTDPIMVKIYQLISIPTLTCCHELWVVDTNVQNAFPPQGVWALP